jgi:hypothetical protein
MTRVVVLLSTAALAATLAASATTTQPAGRIRLYSFSRDSAAGFQDELQDVFRRELGKHVESFTEVAYDLEGAQVSVQFLGQGDLTVELGEPGEPARYLWRPDEQGTRFWALVRVGSFSKEFSLEGSTARDLSRLAKKVADWIRDNSGPIREKSR